MLDDVVEPLGIPKYFGRKGLEFGKNEILRNVRFEPWPKALKPFGLIPKVSQ